MIKNIIVYIIFTATVFSQNLPVSEDSSHSNTRKIISVAGVSAVYISGLFDAYHMWWKNEQRPFHFYKPQYQWCSDPATLGIDKAGHFYTSYFLYHVQKNIFLWGGFDSSFSTKLSAALSGSFAVLIEVGDAFSDYGFDYQDLVFNLGGVGYGLLQDEYPFFKNFNIKWSFIPSRIKSFPPSFSEHYSGHIYWITIDIHNLFKESFGKYFPPYIQPAIGFSISEANPAKREWVFGLDFNLKAIFGNTNTDWDYLTNSIDLIHLPAPGIKFTNKEKPYSSLFLLN